MFIEKVRGGLNTRLTQTNIEDDEFHVLRNVYSWHKSLYTKQTNSIVGRLAVSQTTTAYVLTNAGTALFNLTAPISPSTITITDGTNTWTSPAAITGELVSNTAATGTINYATGAITLAGGVPSAGLTITYSYYPLLPVLGITVWSNVSSNTLSFLSFEQLIFDAKRCYSFDGNIQSLTDIPDHSYFTNSLAPCLWNGESYQLFQFAQAGGALFVSNQTPMMQVALISALSVNAGVVTITTAAPHQLQGTDSIWINEVQGLTGINGQTITSLNIISPTQFSFVLPVTGTYTSGGMFQYLTRAPSTTGDGLRYYSSAGAISGFVNYAPPTSSAQNPDYICGCKTMLFLGGRICLFGVYLATSAQAAAGAYRYLSNTFFYSSIVSQQIGSPFYASLNPFGASYVNEGAFYSFPSGQYGGYYTFSSSTGIASAIVWKLQYAIVSFNIKDIYRLEITDNPIIPFRAYLLSSQYGGTGTNASISLSEGGLLVSKAGFLGIDASSSDRIDMPVPDQVNSISYQENGFSRIVCYVDNYLEAVFFTFPSVSNTSSATPFNDTSLFFNYRENTWALLDESFTCYGSLLGSTQGHTYGSLTEPWSAYNWPWNQRPTKGFSSAINICGNQQGFVFSKQQGSTDSGSDPSLSITSISYANESVTLVIKNHNLNLGRYVYFSGISGTWGSLINRMNGRVVSIIDINTVSVFLSDITPTGTETYFGGGFVTVIDNFQIETKSFSASKNAMVATKLKRAALQIKASNNGNFSLYVKANTSNIYANIPSDTYIPVNLPDMFNGADTEMGTNNNQTSQELLWKFIETNIIGFCISLVITKSDEQMIDPANNGIYLEINSIGLDIVPEGNLFNT